MSEVRSTFNVRILKDSVNFKHDSRSQVVKALSRFECPVLRYYVYMFPYKIALQNYLPTQERWKSNSPLHLLLTKLLFYPDYLPLLG